MEPTIIYEDNNILAINKPSGLVVHSDGKTNIKTLVDWIVSRYPEMEKIGEPLTLSSGEIIHRAGIVHRLDKDTSGVLIVAKNQETFLFLKKQFQSGTIKKEYRTIVYGLVKEKNGVIETPIGRSAKDFRIRSTDARARGLKRKALTEYTVLAFSDSFSYLSVYPKTGRTHQIRVHLKSIQHPVLCDILYAPRRACPPEIGRLALHAHKIQARLPNETVLIIEAPLPDDFKNALHALFGLRIDE